MPKKFLNQIRLRIQWWLGIGSRLSSRLQSPRNSGSLFYNYKGCHSIVLIPINASFSLMLRLMAGRVIVPFSTAHHLDRHWKRRRIESTFAKMFTSGQQWRQNALRHGRQCLSMVARSFLLENILRPYARRYLDSEKRAFNFRLIVCTPVIKLLCNNICTLK